MENWVQGSGFRVMNNNAELETENAERFFLLLMGLMEFVKRQAHYTSIGRVGES